MKKHNEKLKRKGRGKPEQRIKDMEIYQKEGKKDGI